MSGAISDREHTPRWTPETNEAHLSLGDIHDRVLVLALKEKHVRPKDLIADDSELQHLLSQLDVGS